MLSLPTSPNQQPAVMFRLVKNLGQKITPSSSSSSANTHHLPLLHELLVSPVDILADVALAANLLGLLLLLVVDNGDPVVRHLALGVLALVAVLGLPVLGSVVVLQLAVAALGLDALLVGELLPLGLLLLFGNGLLARQMCDGRGECELQRLVVGGLGDGAGGQELVDQALGGVARNGSQDFFLVLGQRGQRVGVVQRRVPRSNVNGWGLGSMCAILCGVGGCSFSGYGVLLFDANVCLCAEEKRWPRRNLGLGKIALVRLAEV
jgi:hypothetical protein